MSRRGILFFIVTVLILLDLGRSLNAHFGYLEPMERWQPDPDLYADLTWPPGKDLSETALLGQRIYAKRCAICHGPDGKGNGPAAPSMIPRPRDFTQGKFKYKTTAKDQPPSDSDLFQTVSKGLNASAMPYWHDLLNDNEIKAVVAYIKKLSPVFKKPVSEPIAIPPRSPPDTTSTAKGRKLFATQGCVVCHGHDGRGGLTLEDSKGYPVVSRDLTAPWTFRGGSQSEEIWLRLTTGLAPGPMPSYQDKMTPEERWHVVNYVLSLARPPPWVPGGKLEGPGYQEDLVKRGEYIVHAEMCGLCHTQVNRTGIYRGDDYYLAGGMRVGAYPHGFFVSRNLTSDPDTGLGNKSVDQIARDIRTGRATDRLLNFLAMPWMYLHGLTQEDALAIASYLKTLPSIHNEIPPALHFGVLETLFIKFYGLLVPGRAQALTFADGNFGGPRRGLSPAWIQNLLIYSQGLVLVFGIIFYKISGSRKKEFDGGKGRRIQSIFQAFGTVLIFLFLWGVYHFPALSIIPPENIAASTAGAVQEFDPGLIKSPEQMAMANRGKYLFTVASCAFCHEPDGSGGSKISWKEGFGTIWVRNITSHSDNGIGLWSDREIARAIRSGVTPDGRILHWQGMIWDHAGNWDEEDIRSIIVFLRTLPPINKKIPEPHSPTERDCQVYTFILDGNFDPGCEP